MIMVASGNFVKAKQLVLLSLSLEVSLLVLAKLFYGHHKENIFHYAPLRKTKVSFLDSSGLFI